jgi:topoisomerase-4 subunit A
MIRNPKISHAELMALMPGPDFPGGGQIITPPARSPRCTERPRQPEGARALEDRRTGARPVAGGGHRTAAGRSSQKVLEEIEELTNPKIKLGKKALTPEQLALKALILACSTPCATNRAAKRRCAWCSSRSRRTRTRPSSCTLLAHTSLEPCLDQPGDDRRRWPSAPEGLTDILTEWISFRFATVTRRTQFRCGRSTTASTSWKAGKRCC